MTWEPTRALLYGREPENAVIVECPTCEGRGWCEGYALDADLVEGFRCEECDELGSVAMVCECGELAHKECTVEYVNCDGELEEAYHCWECKEGEQVSESNEAA